MSIKLPVQLIFDHEFESAEKPKEEVPVEAPKMRKPVSAAFQPWSSYPTLPYHFIEDDFVHHSLFTLNASLSHARGGAEVNQVVNSSPLLRDQTCFWISLPQGRSLYARLNTSDYFKLHLDNGVSNIFGKRFNLYGAVSAPHNFSALSWRLGLRHVSKDIHSDCRVKYTTGKKQEATFSTRNLYKSGKFTYGFIGMTDLRTWVLSNCNFLIGYKPDPKTDVFIRAEHFGFRRKNPESWKGLFDNFLLDAVYSHNSTTTVGAELAFQPKVHAFKWVQLVFETDLSKDITSKFKIKASHDSIEGAVTARKPVFSKQGTLSVGLHTINPHKQGRLFSWGTQLQFNL